MSKLFYNATITAAIYTTEGVLSYICITYFRSNLRTYSTTFDFNLCAYSLAVSGSMSTLYHTHLTSTIDITLDSATSDCQFGTLHITHFPPVNSRDWCRAIQLIESSHATDIDVTALGVRQAI